MKRSTEQLYMERILNVLVFIQRNLDEKLSLDNFCGGIVASAYLYEEIGRTRG